MAEAMHPVSACVCDKTQEQHINKSRNDRIQSWQRPPIERQHQRLIFQIDLLSFVNVFSDDVSGQVHLQGFGKDVGNGVIPQRSSHIRSTACPEHIFYSQRLLCKPIVELLLAFQYPPAFLYAEQMLISINGVLLRNLPKYDRQSWTTYYIQQPIRFRHFAGEKPCVSAAHPAETLLFEGT